MVLIFEVHKLGEWAPFINFKQVSMPFLNEKIHGVQLHFLLDVHINYRNRTVFMLAASFFGDAYVRIHTRMIINFEKPRLGVAIKHNVKAKYLVAGAGKHVVCFGAVRVDWIWMQLYHIGQHSHGSCTRAFYTFLDIIDQIRITKLFQLLIKSSQSALWAIIGFQNIFYIGLVYESLRRLVHSVVRQMHVNVFEVFTSRSFIGLGAKAG